MSLVRNFLNNEDCYKCRLCLIDIHEEEMKFTIDYELRNSFFELTQTELHTSELYSQHVCESCLVLTTDFVAWKTQFIENQQKLENTLTYEETIVDETAKLNSKEDLTNAVEVAVTFIEEHLETESETDQIHLEKVAQLSETNVQNERLNKSSRRMKLCTGCGKNYSSQAYKRHYERVHLKMKNYYCDYCIYSSYTRSHMEIHLRSHLKIKTHFCEQCGESFGSSNILKQHFLKHKNERPFICDQPNCAFAFKSVYALRRHQKTHSLDKRKWACGDCDASFADSWHLKRHQQSHKVQTLPCQRCDKTFKTDERLKAHQVYHQKPKYRCDQCQKEFFKRHSLTAHQRTHANQRDFHCSRCTNKYFKLAHLNRHMKSHLKSETLIVKEETAR